LLCAVRLLARILGVSRCLYARDGDIYCCYRRTTFYDASSDYGKFIRAIVLVFTEPAELFRISFQLSFAAVFGIAVSLAASLATAPAVAYHFHQFSWIAPIANVVTLPLLSLVIIFALCALGLSVISLHLAHLYGATASALLAVSHSFLEFFNQFPVTVAGASAFQVALGAVLLLAMVLLYPSFRNLASALVVLIMMGLLLARFPIMPASTMVAARDQMVLVHNSRQQWLLLQDRRPIQPFHLDLGVARYLSLLPEATTIYAGGPVAMAHLRFVPVAAVDTVLVPTFVFPSEIFWQAVDYVDSCRIPLRRVQGSVWQCDSVVRYSIIHNRLEFHGRGIDTAIVLPQLQRGTLLLLPPPP